MKKILAIVLAAVMLLSMTACGAAAKKDTYVVGICQLVQHDALDAATKGFRDALTARGIQTTIRASRGEDIQAACGLLSTRLKGGI